MLGDFCQYSLIRKTEHKKTKTHGVMEMAERASLWKGAKNLLIDWTWVAGEREDQT